MVYQAILKRRAWDECHYILMISSAMENVLESIAQVHGFVFEAIEERNARKRRT